MSSAPEASEPLHGLYALTPDDNLTPRLAALVESALQGGVKWVQYRNKTAPAPLRRTQAIELLRICRTHGAKLIINDDVWLAVEIGADGVHLGKSDMPGGGLATARDALGSKRILGVSCYDDLARAELAVHAGADYIAVGSVFASASKPEATRASLATLTEATSRFKLPVVAIGGITAKNAPQVLAAGADMVAVLSDLFNAMDIKSQAEKFRKLFKNHKSRLS
ncbi:MAG: thiamine phosphate synthase [Gammaproteobacteria bacterium]|nr:thiamine phosphate synthase [Rhodocyclaceae bacterium]MBU3910212.1 thiamine phosphate synthase [Gammaproteobacteria bacterium]MBU3988798.1 thiamine phosphate synthase [Gammaproteobacteria bacterium]MBU4004489.1 thiamine phosphate synthase [Gammaproteobacteria bacterium]MBU4022674.1 thiamine phosphate synthase [Gammaproteobacteria bacterium]